MSREEFEKAVVARAMTDAQFRARLVADPKTALQEEFGLELPAEVQFQVFQETPTSFCLVLPPVPEELTDRDLAGVAGGIGLNLAQGKIDLPLASLRTRMAMKD